MDSNTENQGQSMNGEFEFYPDGNVHIKAYGYEGCLFACDTLSNDLKWKIQGDTLQITDQNDHSGLFYRIEYITDDSMHLVLLDDIHVLLQKI